MYKRQVFACFIFVLVIGLTSCIFVQLSPKHQAKETIDLFYSFEQEGRFNDSWELFHSQMKDRFGKGHYIQDRAHVFMNHFGVSTFTYELSGADKVNNWKMEEESKVMDTAYKVIVTQTFKGKYGNFSIVQDVYATKEDGDWKILWNYKK
ncbi:hypothetical protein [Aquibacillus albus]|uniref:DUF4878 domain-containing protein n=1 Tax=Aquibacillus albus TaxID=1168171 RepID=A0ABS2MWR8_9BACI|nr:hypothetical protein [Aquibacillus albus]MBM7570339.1 hypothetical protein [Aquibacillus albus]